MQVDILTYGHRKNIVPGMAKPAQGKTGTWIVKQVPQELMVRARIAALTQGKTVRGLLMELVEAHLQEMEKKGLLPKGRKDG
jgi:hypothetical protein